MLQCIENGRFEELFLGSDQLAFLGLLIFLRRAYYPLQLENVQSQDCSALQR